MTVLLLFGFFLFEFCKRHVGKLYTSVDSHSPEHGYIVCSLWLRELGAFSSFCLYLRHSLTETIGVLQK